MDPSANKMTPAELRPLVANANIYKMSLGKTAKFRKEALEKDVLVFASEKVFHEAVLSGDETEIARTGRLIKTEHYPSAGAPENAHSVWRRSIESFRSLPKHTLIVHWEADTDHLHWGLTEDTFTFDREELGVEGQLGLVFHRPLAGGWRKSSIGGMPLSHLHPKARDLAVNMATLNRVQTDPDYFRNLISDLNTSTWEARPDWREKAKATGWYPKDRAAIRKGRPDPSTAPFVQETADYFEEEICRMAATAMHTTAYANGQTVVVIVKAKDIDFTRSELEEEIASLLTLQQNCCALSGHKFRQPEPNPHLRTSLDRKDSNLGYIAGNLQVVTRAANFFKSASDEKDWALKAAAMEQMAYSMQQRPKMVTAK
jgi:hypothetical protein